MMFGLIQSELLKMRHTFGIKLIVFAPLSTLLLGYLLSGSYVQLSAYNWWYTILLPIVVSMLSASTIAQERNTRMQNILCLPIPFARIWLGKALALTLLLFVSNFFLWLITTIMGFATKQTVSPLSGLMGCMLLFLTYLWQIPFVILLASFMGYLPTMILSVMLNLIFSAVGVEKDWFFLNPYAIPARVVCPFFKMHPNGIPLEEHSPLLNGNYIFSGLLVSALVAVLMLWVCSKTALKGVQNHG